MHACIQTYLLHYIAIPIGASPCQVQVGGSKGVGWAFEPGRLLDFLTAVGDRMLSQEYLNGFPSGIHPLNLYRCRED